MMKVVFGVRLVSISSSSSLSVHVSIVASLVVVKQTEAVTIPYCRLNRADDDVNVAVGGDDESLLLLLLLLSLLLSLSLSLSLSPSLSPSPSLLLRGCGWLR